MHAVLRQALTQAVRWRLVLRNVCDAVEPPRVRPPELTTWTAAEARAFLDGTARDDLAGLWEATLLTAMRLGEFLALRWEDVDLERGAIAVRRTVTRDEDGRPTVGVPKGGRNRRVLLAAPAVSALRRHRERQAERRLKLGAAWADAGLVFERGDGIMLTHQAIEERFNRRIARLGLPPDPIPRPAPLDGHAASGDGRPPEDRVGAAGSRWDRGDYGSLQARHRRDAPGGAGAAGRSLA